MRSSAFYSFSKEEMKEIIENSITIREVISKCGFSDKGNNRKTFFNVIEHYSLSIELSLLKERSLNFAKNKSGEMRRKKDEDVFCENSSVSRGTVKNRVLKDNLIEYKCKKCKNIGEWMGEPLSLQLEHINGIGNDHRLENLCFLCPSCHSQTPTYAGKTPAKREKLQKNALKLKKEREFLNERISFLNTIDTSKYGWVKKVQDKWGVSHTQVRRWIKKHYPNFYITIGNSLTG